MEEYHRLLRKVLDHGSYREDRTGTGAYSVFGEQSRYDLSLGFPLVTTKKLHLRSIIHELLWFLKGDTTSPTCGKTRSASGTSGPTKTASSARSTAPSGGAGRVPPAPSRSTRSRACSTA